MPNWAKEMVTILKEEYGIDIPESKEISDYFKSV